MEKFPSVFDGQVRVMKDEQFKITLQCDAKLFFVKTHHSVYPSHKQQGGYTVMWINCHNQKGADRIRTCIDLSKLN